MDILYKRFFIVALMIATMGILTANLIQQTRSEPVMRTLMTPKTLLGDACVDEETCNLTFGVKRIVMFG